MNSDYYDLLPLVVTAKEMAEIDRKTIEEIGIPGMVLMENAGRKVVSVIRKTLGSVKGRRIVIVCGKGNNGGDGYVIARYLLNMGAHVTVFLLGESKDVKGDAGRNLEILKKMTIDVLPFLDREHESVLSGAHLIVDAMLGTGVSGPLKGMISEVVDIINDSNAPVIAVDLPTGMNTDTGAVYGKCIKARHTVTMGHIKRGLLFSPAREHAGKVYVAEIGFPKAASTSGDVKCFRISKEYVKSVLPQRQKDTYKKKCGQIFLIAGSAGLTGAAVLSSEATLRVGAGMAMLGIPESLNPIVEQKLTEVMTVPLPETDEQSISIESKDLFGDKLLWANTVAIGPGLTTHPDSTDLVTWVLRKYDKPVVVDADALNCLKNDTKIFAEVKAPLILTPHPGELSRLIKSSTKEILSDPIEVAKKTAKDFNVIVVLKGAPTVIASPDGYVFINSTGNPGMATAGMGDVLTGVIAGLAAQGLSPLDAAIAGVYLHGLAGDIAKSRFGEAGLLAGDVLNCLPAALKRFGGFN